MNKKYLIFVFTFQNEFCEEIENKICNIVKPLEEEKKDYNGEAERIGKEIVTVAYRKNRGAMVTIAHPDVSYVYSTVIFIINEKKGEIMELLKKTSKNIYEHYGEDHSKELRERDVHEIENIIKTSKKYGFYNKIKEFLE